MKSITATKRILTMLLSVLILASAVPFAAAAETETAFVSENLLRKEGVIDLENSKTSMYQWAHGPTVIADSTRLNSKKVFEKLIDGELTYAQGEEPDIYAEAASSRKIYGLLYALTDTYYCDSIKLYGGADDYYRVYASDDLSMLYHNENAELVSTDGSENGTNIELGRNIKYIALFYDEITTLERTAREDYTNGRPKEIELWSGDEATRFDSVNLLTSEHYTEGKAVLMDAADGSVTDYPNHDSKINTVINGKSDYTHQDFSNIDGKHIGLQFAFDAPQYVGEVIIDSGTYWTADTDYDEYFDVYASNSLSELYSEKSKVAENVHCDNQMGAKVKLNQYATYISIINKKANGSMRMRQLLIKSADGTGIDVPKVFISENIFTDEHITAKDEIVFDSVNNTAELTPRFNSNNVFDILNDGDLSYISNVDVYSYSPTSTKWIGALFTFDATYFCDKFVIYAGFNPNKDFYRVYASDSLDNLYSEKNMAAKAIECDGTGQEVKLNKSVKYIALICDNISCNEKENVDTIFRLRELQLWTGDDSNAFISENLLQTDLAEKSTFHMYVSNGSVTEGNKFDQNGALDISVDGDTETTKAVYDCIEGWDYPIYPGARYTLNNTAYTDSLTVYANGKIKVYASDALDTLYAQYNCIADEIAVSLTGTKIDIKNNVKYLAIFMIGYADIAEFELWSGDPNAKPEEPEEPDPNSLKVLTIGNSFAENASIYASEIAKINGKDLTFGYLKFPSCTIDQHYQAATENLAVFKFQITYPDGSKTTVKNEASWNNPDPATSATVAEALEYYDWDVIVFQQESNNARTLSTYSNLGNLIEFVKGYCPDAKLAIHEVWRWGIWSYDDYLSIKNNTAAVAEQYSLDIIPSGAAFENARTALGSDTIVNDTDNGHYQHANGYGQYLAGCVYTGALFGIEISETTFASHPAVTNAETAAILTKAANDAVAEYYPGEVEYPLGDLNLDGQVNAEDLAFMRQMLIGIECGTDANVDLNNDNSFDIKDYIRLKKIIAGLA